MDHYAEFRLLPDTEFSANHLMNALFATLHRTLVELGSTDIGVSFPALGAQPTGVGERLRLHGSESALRPCIDAGWFKSIRDHASRSEIRPVPENVRHVQVRRVQHLGGSDLRRLRRRLMARSGCSQEQAAQRIPASAAERLTLPFLSLRSASTGQMYRLFIEQKSVAQPVGGAFNSYGISKTATVPYFD